MKLRLSFGMKGEACLHGSPPGGSSLDHVGAEVAEHHPGEGSGDVLAELQYPYPAQSSPHCNLRSAARTAAPTTGRVVLRRAGHVKLRSCGDGLSASPQGNRILGREDLEQVAIVPSGLLPLGLDADLCGCLLFGHVHRHMPDDCQVLVRIASPDPCSGPHRRPCPRPNAGCSRSSITVQTFDRPVHMCYSSPLCQPPTLPLRSPRTLRLDHPRTCRRHCLISVS